MHCSTIITMWSDYSAFKTAEVCALTVFYVSELLKYPPEGFWTLITYEEWTGG